LLLPGAKRVQTPMAAVPFTSVRTSAQVSMNTHVARRAGQTLVFAERDVLLRRRVDVFFRQTEVDDMDDMLLSVGVPSDQKVLRFYVPVYQMF